MEPGSATTRALTALVLAANVSLAGSAPAVAGPAPRPRRPPAKVTTPALKPVPTPYPLAGLRLLAEAQVRLAQGAPTSAERALTSAQKLAPHANVTFNLAVVHEHQGELDLAIAALRRYLEEAPAAPDRAEVERRIEDLSIRRPRPVYLGQRRPVDGVAPDADAVLIIDGARVVPSPSEVLFDGAMHIVSRVSASTYGNAFVRGAAGAWSGPLRVGIDVRAAEGNVVIQVANYAQATSFTMDGHTMFSGQPFKLGRGRYRIAEFGLCRPITFEVRDPAELTYVLLRPPENRSFYLNDNYHRPDGEPDNCVEVSAQVVRTRVPGRR